MKFFAAITVAVLATVASAVPAPAADPAPAANVCGSGKYFLLDELQEDILTRNHSWSRLLSCAMLQWICLHAQEPHSAMC